MSFRSEVLHWKYFRPRPGWDGSRSFVAMQNGDIAAHAGVWPVHFLSAEKEVNGVHLIDWAASRSVPGAGVHLLRKLAALTDVLLTIGGSAATQQILPKLGYKKVGALKRSARVVRPLMQFRAAPPPQWKRVLRFLRNSAWAYAARISYPQGWRAQYVSSFSSDLDRIISLRRASKASSARTVSTLNYMLACPAVRFSGFLLFRGDDLQGYFMVSQVGCQARIVDLWVIEDTPACWRSACAIAARSLEENSDTHEIVAATSFESLHNSWLQAGFRQRQLDPVYLYDPANLLADALPIHLSLLDGDQCFLHDAAHPYLT